MFTFLLTFLFLNNNLIKKNVFLLNIIIITKQNYHIELYNKKNIDLNCIV